MATIVSLPDDRDFSQNFSTELEAVRKHLLVMGGAVEKQVADALTALVQGDSDLALAVREREEGINDMEVAIDQEVACILARRHPAATDLRLVLACAKAATDLERIGDEAAKIARQALELIEQGESPRGYVEARHIGNHVGHMIQGSLNAFARLDANLALNVAKEDRAVDREYRAAAGNLATYMREDPSVINQLLSLMWVLRSMERIGDHARNIAEHVIYVVKGTDVRHLGVKQMKQQLFS